MTNSYDDPVGKTTAGEVTLRCKPLQCDKDPGERANVRTKDGIASFCLAGCQVERTHSVGIDLGSGMETAHWYEHTGAACAADETPPYPDAMDATELNCATSASGNQACLGDSEKNCGLVNGEEMCADDPPGCGTVNGETVCPDDLPEADNCATSASGNRACVTDDGTLDDPENQADEEIVIKPVDLQGNPIPGTPSVHVLEGDGEPPDEPCDPQTEQCDGEPDPGDCDPETEECEGEGDGGTFTGGSLSAKTFAKSGTDFMAAISESPLANAANGISGLIPSGGGTCAPIGFGVWGHDISTDAHCQLLADIATQLRLACLFAWCLTGIVVFMRA